MLAAMTLGAPRPITQQEMDFPTIVMACNRDGMEALRKGQLQAAFEHFKYAETVIIANQADTGNSSLLAVTCNNLGCYFKKTGKHHGALSYLRRALKMQEALGMDEVTKAGTHLNLCAILSKLSKHDKAVQHALAALELINRRIADSPTNLSQEDYSVLAIAYHNVAMEREFLEEYAAAASAFQAGHQVALRHLGEEHPLSISLSQSCMALLQKSKKLAFTPPGTGRNSAKWTTSVSRPGSRGTPDSLKEGTTTTLLPRLTASPKLDEEEGSHVADCGTRPNSTELAVSVAKVVSLPPVLLGDEALMDLVDEDRGNHVVTSARVALSDFRPNRLIKGSTRAARVVRRSALNDTTKRDEVLGDRVGRPKDALQLVYKRKLAAERIQRTWRSWVKYCKENREWMLVTRVAAIIIQANYRGFRVRLDRKNRAAACIQRHARGIIVRRRVRRHRAAVAIQRIAMGNSVRARLKRLIAAGTKIQALARGAAGRRAFKRKWNRLSKAAARIQCAVRIMIAKRVVGERRALRRAAMRRTKAATDIQRRFRGIQGRSRFQEFDNKRQDNARKNQAATKLQAMARRDLAIRRVDTVRADLLARMNKAATMIRKWWKGHRTRVIYKQHLKEFAAHEAQVRTMQRYARGFLVRLRMWTEASRAESELWAAIEIQRVWRGYLGRVRWESKYEEIFDREMAAAKLQPCIRGWLARCRVDRIRRRIARSEFERARARFYASRRIQSLARGAQARRLVSAVRTRKVGAAIHIQRILRGHFLRIRLWKQFLNRRATFLQANIRGFMVRRRFMHILACIICIQKKWRLWRRRPARKRNKLVEERRDRVRTAKALATKVDDEQRLQEELAEKRRSGVEREEKRLMEAERLEALRSRLAARDVAKATLREEGIEASLPTATGGDEVEASKASPLEEGLEAAEQPIQVASVTPDAMGGDLYGEDAIGDIMGSVAAIVEEEEVHASSVASNAKGDSSKKVVVEEALE